MDPALHALLLRVDALPDQLHEVREGVRKAVLIAEIAPEMGLTQARKVLELVVREVYERRCGEPPGTRPLENLLQRLLKEGHLPARLDAYANAVRLLGNVGTHRFGERVTAADVQQCLAQLVPVLDWYSREERPAGHGGQPEEPRYPRPAAPEHRPGYRPAVVPKGLRSFDAGDAGFFLELLPGPRDENGLPEGIRFWKRRIETGEEPGFTVGVLYGPSGCGKSSLVKAGLLPRLAGHVLPVYVEAAGEGTEVRLLTGLRRRCPGLPAEAGLAAAVAALRQGQGLAGRQKALLVLDQFEQFLHARRAEEDTELARALRQCDGERVQALLLVRDDFWLGLSRFMADLNMEMNPGQNCALVDLFGRRHAHAVLAAFGQAFGTVAEPPSAPQQAFLAQAVEGLAEDGRVVPVRLALFAEMVKARPWCPATLKAVGGASGVGVAFLEDTFGPHATQVKHRLHQDAARAVLKALLPEQGTDIKGQMQSQAKLLRASGYEGRPRDFDDLLRLLDGELRLITPTEPPVAGAEGERYFQLTHDYLVPALREWLVRKQRETWRGRAELRLAERAAAWAATPARRHLPAWWEWLDIRLLTLPRDWTEAQRKMMHRADRFHLARGTLLAAAVAFALLTGVAAWGQIRAQRRQDRAEALVKRLLVADAGQVPAIIAEMKDYRPLVDPLLRQELERQPEKSRERLHAGLALLPGDPGQADYLGGRLLDGATPAELAVLRDALRDKGVVRGRLWAVLGDEKAGAGPRFRAACALAGYDLREEEAARWQAAAPFVAGELIVAVQQDPASYPAWLLLLRPQRDRLARPLEDAFRKRERPEDGRTAASVLADCLGDRPAVLAELALDADERQFILLFQRLQAYPDLALPPLRDELAKQADRSDDAKERLAQRQANAAVALLRLGEPDRAWPLLRFAPASNPDPRRRSYLIHCLISLGADPATVARQLKVEVDGSARRSLLLCLGEFGPDRFAPADRAPLLAEAWRLYLDDPDPGAHGAAEWLLRQWGQEAKLRETDRSLATGRVDAPRRWYVNRQDQTMAVIPGPVEFVMGSPATEAGREGGPEGDAETQHRLRIGRSFAIATKEVTVEQFLRFRSGHDYRKDYSPTPQHPVSLVSWYQAAEYCNWLSKREGIPPEQWCYEPNRDGKFAEGMRMRRGHLGLQGYRLPTEAEWEFACRAGAVTSRYYGETEELLDKYAWYTRNSQDRWMLPVGSLRPNDLGLFDMLGNAGEWSEDKMTSGANTVRRSADDDGLQDEGEIKDRDPRVLRGGSFDDHAANVRSAYRLGIQPVNPIYDLGFRPARTLH